MDEILYFDYTRKSSALLIFVFNATLFASLLLVKGIKEQKKDIKWLATFLFLGALYISPFMLGFAGWYGKDNYAHFLFFVPFQQLFLIGPVFYFYVQSLLNRDQNIRKKDIIHFVPAILYLIYSLVVFIGDQFIFEEFYFYADGRDKDFDFWYQMAGLFSMLFYLILSLKYYRNYRQLSLQEVSFADEIAFKWIEHFAIAFSLILVLRVLFFILYPEWGQFGSKFWYYLCFSILLLYIAISGYSNAIRATIHPGANPLVQFVPHTFQTNVEANQNIEELLVTSEWREKITYLFEVEHVYTNPNLTLSDVAQLLDTNRNIISKAINQEFKLNFNDYVNEKRAEAVIAKLNKGDHIKNTLLGIAFDSGFNSKTTFNRAFKKYTGATPKQYISQKNL